VNGEDLIKTVEDGYAKDITDEFIKPIISGSEGSRIKSKYISRSNPSGNCSSCRGRHPFHGHSGLYLDMVVMWRSSGMLTSIGLSGRPKTAVISRIRSFPSRQYGQCSC
jgi:hypothetical protein